MAQRRSCALVSGLALLLSGCGLISPTEQPTLTAVVRPTAQIVVTTFASYVIGDLVMVGECLTVIDEGQIAYTLVWPPDVSAVVEGEAVTITTGLISGNIKTAHMHIGDQVFIGGGEVSILDDQLKSSIPNDCSSPYWVPGGKIGPAPTPAP